MVVEGRDIVVVEEMEEEMGDIVVVKVEEEKVEI